MSYAAKHGYESLCEEAAPHTLATDASVALEYMNPACFTSWVSSLPPRHSPQPAHRPHSQVIYREHWLNLLRDMHTPIPAVLLHKGGLSECELWLPFEARVLQDLGGAPTTLDAPHKAVDRHRTMVEGCVQCKKRAQHWVYDIQAKTQGLPKFQLALPPPGAQAA